MGRMREIGEALEGDERYLLQCRPDERVMTRDGVGLLIRRIDPGGAFVSVLQGEETSTGFDRRIHMSRVTVVVPWREPKVRRTRDDVRGEESGVPGGEHASAAAGRAAGVRGRGLGKKPAQQEVNDGSRTGKSAATAVGFQGILDMIQGKRQDRTHEEKVEREGAAACLELVRAGGRTHAQVVELVRRGKWGAAGGWSHDAKWLGNLAFHARRRGLL